MTPLAPLFKTAGDPTLCSLAGCLLLAAGAVYGDSRDTTYAGQGNGRELMDAILAAARTAGYTQVDTLATLLAGNSKTERVMTMAIQACALIPSNEQRRVMSEFWKERQQ